MMKDETKLIENIQNNSQSMPGKSAGWSKAAYAAAGFVGGVATGAGAQAVLGAEDEHAQIDPAQLELPTENNMTENNQSRINDRNVTSEYDITITEPDTTTLNAPAAHVLHSSATPATQPSDVIIATDEGVRVAQVSDEVTFGEAFADARGQVGTGGVFEWKGKLYSTYYKEEWENMTASEHREYQEKIDYDDVLTQHDHANYAEATATVTTTTAADNAESTLKQNVHVLDVEQVQYEGHIMNVALVEVDGQQALCVDVNNDGFMDQAAADLNQDGIITNEEIFDISAAHLHVDQLVQHMDNTDDAYTFGDNIPEIGDSFNGVIV